ncbi:MAG: hypothetical protein IMZ52_06895 [Actinobacteria bacterium]|nr:hypothetical protein [Actinomycetota bacterium]
MREGDIIAILGGYRYSSSVSGSTFSEGIVNVGTMKISGLANGAGLMCCLYSYNYATNKWLPNRWT